MNFSGRTSGRFRIAILLLVLSMILTACMSSGGDEDPTATPEATSTPTEEPQPTATPTEEPTATPEPTATEEPFRPAPTVAVPRHQSTPTPVPVPTETPLPEPTAGSEEGGLDLVYSGNLQDWAAGEVDIGSGFPSEAGYHLYNTSSDGVAIWNGLTDIVLADQVVAVDLRMISQGQLGYGCLAIRTELDALSYGYSLCLNGSNQSVADFTYLDADNIRQWDILVDFDQREQSLPSTEWNNLMIASVGQGFAFYVNGELIGSLQHAGASSGQIGIYVYNFDETPTEWVFTNLEIYSSE